MKPIDEMTDDEIVDAIEALQTKRKADIKRKRLEEDAKLVADLEELGRKNPRNPYASKLTFADRCAIYALRQDRKEDYTVAELAEFFRISTHTLNSICSMRRNSYKDVRREYVESENQYRGAFFREYVDKRRDLIPALDAFVAARRTNIVSNVPSKFEGHFDCTYFASDIPYKAFVGHFKAGESKPPLTTAVAPEDGWYFIVYEANHPHKEGEMQGPYDSLEAAHRDAVLQWWEIGDPNE